METSSRELPMLLSDFAARVGASVDLVYYHVRRGLIGQKHHGRTFFYEDDVQKFLNRPDRRTSPYRRKKSEHLT
jgi:hypothetical protein